MVLPRLWASLRDASIAVLEHTENSAQNQTGENQERSHEKQTARLRKIG
jgi:hypothetical protein